MNETMRSRPEGDNAIFTHLKEVARTELEMRPDQADRISLETPIVEGFELDSLRQVVLLTNLEETYGFELSIEDRERLLELRTVGDLVRFIRQRTASDG